MGNARGKIGVKSYKKKSHWYQGKRMSERNWEREKSRMKEGEGKLESKT